MSAKARQRMAVILGIILAGTGFMLVALAFNAFILAAGIALAGTSAGLCWTPFNDMVKSRLRPEAQAGALSAVSTGATLGVALAGATFLIAAHFDLSWRLAWVSFAILAVVALFLSCLCPSCGSRQNSSPFPDLKTSLRPDVMPLLVIAFGFGAANAVYISYASVFVVETGGLASLPDELASALIFVIYGICGLVGLTTGWVEKRMGLWPLVTTIFATFSISSLLIILAPNSWVSVVLSAGLHGMAVMATSALLAFASLRLFPGSGTYGLTLALVTVAIGNVLGPMIVGHIARLADLQIGLYVCLLITVAISVWFAMTRPRIKNID